jgi:predicted transcriptional regulator
MTHELESGMEKFMAFSSDTRRRIMVSLLEASVKKTPLTMGDIEMRVARKAVDRQLSFLQQIGFVNSRVVDLPNRSPHRIYFLTEKATKALNDVGITESLIEKTLKPQGKT